MEGVGMRRGDMVQVNATIPRELKVRLFVLLTSRNTKFTQWLLQQVLKEVREHEGRAPVPMK
jgi:hypothetical protein